MEWSPFMGPDYGPDDELEECVYCEKQKGLSTMYYPWYDDYQTLPCCSPNCLKNLTTENTMAELMCLHERQVCVGDDD